MENKCSKHSGVSAEEVVGALLERSVDPKSFAMDRMPGVFQEASEQLGQRFYREYKAGRFPTFYAAYDRAVEMVDEIIKDYGLSEDQYFRPLLHHGFDLAAAVQKQLNEGQ